MQGLLLATAFSLAIALVATPLLIDVFRARGVGQLIREDGPADHQRKHGTPTMGGLVLIAAATIGYFGAHVSFEQGVAFTNFTTAGLLVMGTTWALGLLGALDDYAKIRHRRSLGLNKRGKFVGQVVIGVALAWAGVAWTGLDPEITWAGHPIPYLGALPFAVFAAWVVIMLAGTSNAVNLTDGLDGLASGSSAMAFFVFLIIGFWEFRNQVEGSGRVAEGIYPQLSNLGPGQGAFLDVAIAAAALLGACLGFLWWNAAPARIFMGDTGSLALGGGMAALALFTRTQLLLAVIGGLFLIETLSVILQVIAYRGFGKRRIFAMAPLHHHFELRGWAETTVIVRFWLIAALTAGLGLAIFYTDFLARADLLGDLIR